MTLEEVMTVLEKSGTEQTRKTYLRHGAPADSMFGVKVGDLKPLQKKLKGQQELALQLYATGNSDAMYLAGLIADGSKMTKAQLNRWINGATWYMLSDHTVVGVTCESRHAKELAGKWIESKKPLTASAGWSTWSGIVATQPDEDLDFDHLRMLMQRVVREIETAPNRVRYAMNGFVISVGVYVKPLLKEARAVAKSLGKVEVDMGDTSCKVPVALDYIKKIESMNRIGKKRSTMKC
ncbi:MAG: DNA alkylation repair protein [Planctomycetaceae bacterium]|nr:DNA alkylation repair protein [Planctomycetaceae bacterium]